MSGPNATYVGGLRSGTHARTTSSTVRAPKWPLQKIHFVITITDLREFLVTALILLDNLACKKLFHSC
jgi:hypothetical protein